MDVKELIGERLGNCRIEQIIGRGGMGAVYLAQQERPVRTVAVKVLMPPAGADEDDQRTFLERFRREADTVGKLEHKNILPVYEYSEAMVNGQQLAFLVMPYIRGGTLRERIDEMKRAGRRFSLQTISDYISQIADALSYAHSLGVVHRDVKPANLLFHPDGRLLLSDFGIVRLSAMPALTRAGNFLGTAEYASPEQVRAGELDARSDIYSLGIILYELLTGSVPFTGSNPFVVMSKQLNEPVPSLKNSRPDISPASEFVVKKALAKDPQDRYQSATELAADLRAAITPALSSSSGLRLTGDARNDDLTVADRSWQPAAPPFPRPQPIPQPVASPFPRPQPVSPPVQPAPASPVPAAYPVHQASGSIPPTSPAAPAGTLSPMPGQAGQWADDDDVFEPGTVPPLPKPASTNGAANAAPSTTVKNRRLYYYIVLGVMILAQLPVLGLLTASTAPGLASPGVLGILLGGSINYLALAAIAFTGVTRSRDIRKPLRICLALAALTPLISGYFIAYGASDKAAAHIPLLAFVLLLLSNVYALRLLGEVDAPRDPVESAPVLWRSAIAGALTGLLPLIIIQVFTLLILHASNWNGPLLASMFVALFVAWIGAPTPGAMMAVWLSQKMTFPVLLRTSGMAGLLMFLGAFLVVTLWGLLTANSALFFHQFSQPLLAFVVSLIAFGLTGILRGMLDAWVYYRFIRNRVRHS